MKKLIKKLFGENAVEKTVSKEDSDLIYVVSREVSERSISSWTSLWSVDGRLNSSIMDDKRRILISECGQILKPFEPKMNAEEKQTLSKFARMIISRDKRVKIRECMTIKKESAKPN